MARRKRKNEAAATMARLRWKGVTKAQRSELMKHAVQVREEKRAKRKQEEAAAAA